MSNYGNYGGQAGSGGYSQNYAYGQNPYGQSNNVEMRPIQNPSTQYPSGGAQDSSRDILNRCTQVNAGIQELDQMIEELRNAQNSSLQDSSQNPSRAHRVDDLTSRIFAQNRQLVDQIKAIKSTPGAASSTNFRQVQLAEEKLKASLNKFQTAEMDYRRKFQQQLVRQYRVVNPNATEQEAQEAAQNPTGGVFAQALMQSDRRGEAQTVLSTVRSRHEAIQEVERQMVQLAEMFDQMNRLVVAQEPTVMQIHEQTENVHTNVVEANEQLDGAKKLAAAARRKKWWCLLIAVIIVIILIIVVILGVCVGAQACHSH